MSPMQTESDALASEKKELQVYKIWHNNDGNASEETINKQKIINQGDRSDTSVNV